MMPGLAAVIVRLAAFVLFDVVFLVLLSRSDSTDALGAGLLFFLIVAVAAAMWAGFDAARRGFVPTVIVWAVTALLTGIALTVVYVISDDAAELGPELRDSTSFFVGLLFVPALLGSLVGSLLHRARRSDATS